jgi:hypothetical protein
MNCATLEDYCFWKVVKYFCIWLRLRMYYYNLSLYYSGRFHTVSITNVTTRLLQELKNQTIYNTAKFDSKLGSFASFTAEPFLSTYFDKSQGGAYPHVASTTPLLPILIQFGWRLPADDDFFISEIKLAADSIMQAALDDGQNGNGTIQIRYPNYALDTTPLSEMYGDNVPRLQSIRRTWDPDNVMNLTGGFKF